MKLNFVHFATSKFLNSRGKGIEPVLAYCEIYERYRNTSYKIKV
jgi:hypothetical protein